MVGCGSSPGVDSTFWKFAALSRPPKPKKPLTKRVLQNSKGKKRNPVRWIARSSLPAPTKSPPSPHYYTRQPLSQFHWLLPPLRRTCGALFTVTDKETDKAPPTKIKNWNL